MDAKGMPTPFLTNKPVMGGKVNQYVIRNRKNNFFGLEVKKV